MVTRKSVTILFKTMNTPYTRSIRSNQWGSQANDKTMRSSGNSKATITNDTKGSTVIIGPNDNRGAVTSRAVMTDDV
jgi:hypothetical protein